MTVRLLSFHVPYRCRHAGACCTAGWPIPVESRVHGALLRAVSDQSFVAPAGRTPVEDVDELLDPRADGPDDVTAVMRVAPDGACVCYERSSRLCAIHKQLGTATLPSACRHFPRVVLRDPRGCHVTLSHYCPTAAALLDQPGSVSIADDPDGWDADLEGLDARDALPPLLRPDLLADFDGWDDLERRTVALLVDETTPLGRSLNRLARIVEDVRTWAPGSEPLRARVRAAFADLRHVDEAQPQLAADLAQLRRLVRASLTPGVPGTPPATDWISLDAATLDRAPLRRTVRRFLAAHAFASWAAYQGRGVRTWIRAVLASYAVLAGEAARLASAAGRPLDLPLLIDAVREADRLLRHLMSPEALAGHLSLMEGRSLLADTHQERNR